MCFLGMKVLIPLILLLVALVHTASAKAYYQTKVEMISSATAIAIVEIGEVSEFETKGHLWTYQQKAKARVLNVIKGNMPGNVELHGLENFRCARCEFSEGTALVFLKRDGELWVGSNWHLSIWPIINNNVQWFVSNESRYSFADTVLIDVVSEIESKLK